MKRTFIALLLASIMVLVMGTAAFASSGTWQHDGYGWWYDYDEGGYPASQWENIDGFWYYFNISGYMYTGWLWDGNTWYLLNPDGTMATGWVWDGAWYYLYPTGALATGWITDGYSWYYMGMDGAMQTGWIWDGYGWYYLNDDGSMHTGWLWDGAWYYFGNSGIMQTGNKTIDGITYYFNEHGVWVDYSSYIGHWGSQKDDEGGHYSVGLEIISVKGNKVTFQLAAGLNISASNSRYHRSKKITKSIDDDTITFSVSSESGYPRDKGTITFLEDRIYLYYEPGGSWAYGSFDTELTRF